MKSEIPVPSHDAIALRAAELWRQRGCPVGCDMEIWFEAERQLRAVANTPPAHDPRFRDAKSLRDRVEHEVIENEANDTRSPTSVKLTP